MADTEFQLEPEVSNRALGKLTAIYYKRVREHSITEKMGIIQQLRRLIKKGVGLDEMQIALENYIDHVTKKTCLDHPHVEQPKRAAACTLCQGQLEEQIDRRMRKNIRSFFALENVKLWQRPLVEKRAQRKGPPRDPAMDVFDRFEAEQKNNG